MRAPKGFGKDYFTLAAIQATVVQHHLSATSVRIQSAHLVHTDWETEESENEELEELLCPSTFSLPTHAGHCNCYYNRITRNRIRQNPRPKQRVEPYIYANSVTSPPQPYARLIPTTLKLQDLSMTKTVLSLTAIIALTSPLSAANQYTLEQVSVTASQGTELEKKDVPDSVTIITKEAIKEARVNTLEQALQRLGNLSSSSNGGIGQPTSVFVRGMDSKRTLVLIDGIRYNDVTGLNGAQYPQIALYNVEQIEIIKGAQSGVWGADASAGVINIVTTKAKKGLHGSANLEYGSFDTRVASLQASYATERFDILMGGSYLATDGFSAVEPTKESPDYGLRYDDLGFEKDAYSNKTFNAKLGWNITDEDRLEASLQAINSYIEFDSIDFGTGLPADAPNGPYTVTTNKDRFYSLAYRHKGAVNDLALHYNLSTFDRSQYGGYTGSVNEAKIDDKITYMDNGFLRIGASYQQFEQQKSGGTEMNENYNAVSAFATNYNKADLVSDLSTIITESIRYDRYNAFNDKVTGKIGVKQFVYNDIYFSANIGTGYNVPTLYQLYDTYAGNSAVNPESTLSYEATLGNNIVWVTGFYNKVTDLIDYVSTGPFTGEFQNIEGDSILRGVELGYKEYFAEVIGVTANYTYLDAKNADGQTLARRPKNQVDLSVVYYATENFDLGLNGQYIGKRYDRLDDQGAQTGEYTVVNFVSNVKVNDYITVYGKVDNISDLYYQSVDGYATAGRSLYLGLNATY